jgi:hypothetical protein
MPYFECAFLTLSGAVFNFDVEEKDKSGAKKYLEDCFCDEYPDIRLERVLSIRRYGKKSRRKVSSSLEEFNRSGREAPF